jgi:lipoprotein signal peptidase
MQAARGTSLTGAAATGQPEADESAAAPRGTGMSRDAPRRVGILLGVAAVVLAVDIATKMTVVATLSDRSPLVLPGGFLTLRVSRNPGAAFSIGTSMTAVFTAIAVGVIIFVLRTSRRIRSLPWAVTLGLLLGGAMGNLMDRLFRYPGPLRGWVVDWIQVPHWPVFNLADSSIVCGGVLAVLLAARGLRIDGTTAGQDGAAAPDAGAAREAPAGDAAAGSGAAGSGAAGSGPAGAGAPGAAPADPGQPAADQRGHEHPASGGGA